MHTLIGIDTGGTFTDAVLFDDEHGVLAKRKALTTRHDLAEGIGAALDAVLREGRVAPGAIGMVAVSTTLATNAIVEGQGARVCLVTIGLAERDLDRAGLRAALKDDPVVLLDGGHDAFGDEVRRLDLAPLLRWLETEGETVSAFAVAGQFSVANPGHEAEVRALLEARTGRPVTCGHELTGRLNGPKRALTALLNARLVPVIHHLIDAATGLLRARAIAAPLMIVKGDGSLLSVGEARRKPVETILSGPAASLVGAGYLAGLPDAIVSDIGGTTTDIGLLRGGRPLLDPEGAVVGGHATFVEAVRLQTFGLGADSEVKTPASGGLADLDLGPRRVIPVCLLATSHPGPVHQQLDRQLAMPAPPDTAGRFAVLVRRTGVAPGRFGAAEREILEALASGPQPLDTLLVAYRLRIAFDRLVALGEVGAAGFSPSDAAHVLGLHSGWDAAAASKAAALFARRRGAGGKMLAPDAEAMSRAVLDALIRQSAERLLDVALDEDGFGIERPSRHPLLRSALSRHRGVSEIVARLTLPVVGLGASAATYYPSVGALLSAETLVPDHADVANAVGAVVGRVSVEAVITVSRPDDGLFRVLGEGPPLDFHELDGALAAAEDRAVGLVRSRAARNGAADVETRVSREIVSATVADREMIFEWRLRAVATGRPAAAAPAPLQSTGGSA